MRPRPPEQIFDLEGPSFLPAPEAEECITDTSIDTGAEVENVLARALMIAAHGALALANALKAKAAALRG